MKILVVTQFTVFNIKRFGKNKLKRVNLDQLNQVIVQPLREALIRNEHIPIFDNYEEWGSVKDAAIKLKDPNLENDEILAALDDNLYTILNQGQTPCNSNFLALTYGYTYLFQRINAIENAFKALRYGSSKTRETGLFVDIGCGIGALLIALRNLHENEDFILNYRGYDIVEEVLQVNKNFLQEVYPNNDVTISGKQIESISNPNRENINHVIMVFSYLFSQNGIEGSFNEFEKKIDELFEEFNLTAFYLVHINIRPGRYTKYQEFLDQLRNSGKYIIDLMADTCVNVSKNRLNRLSSNEDNMSCVGDSNVHCCVREIKRV